MELMMGLWLFQAGYEMLYSQYLEREETDHTTVEVMQAILKVNTKKTCHLMWTQESFWIIDEWNIYWIYTENYIF